MPVKREPLRVQSEAFVCLERRHPLRDISVNGKRQAEKVLHLLFVVEVELKDVHINVK
jgi:hypothetical protein